MASTERIWARRRGGRASWLRRLFTRAALAGLAAFIGGFVVFVNALPGEPGTMPRADAIVALTGGAERLAAGLDLLAAEAGSKLLITGLAPTTTRADLQATHSARAQLIACCVDLDWNAENTRGNARETAGWARAHQVRSLIVVTSHYHMPRTMVELAAVLPDVELIPYPVAPDSVRVTEWWSDPATFELLAAEYCKYLASLVRVGADRTLG